MNLIEQFRAARRAAVPILVIESADQPGTIRKIGQATNGHPLMMWDAVRGLVALNETAVEVQQDIAGEFEPSALTDAGVMLSRAVRLPANGVLFMQNAHRVIPNEVVSQGVANVREVFKENAATLILLCPSISLPEELKQDVMILSEPLPNEDEIMKIIRSVCEDAGMDKVPEGVSQIADTLIGLSAFAAEQTLATCIIKDGGKVAINRPALWERKCKAVEQTQGLSIYRGKETFADVGGCDNIKQFISQIVKGQEPPRVILFMDEIEKAFAGAQGDSSGTSQDQLGVMLSWMQDTEADGMIFIGPAGAAKSVIAKASGNEAMTLTISFDLNGMKDKLVGETGQKTRAALKVIDAVSQGRVLCIATCNKIADLPPELRRRFTMGTFYFDLPTKQEREKIWPIYFKKYGLKKQSTPNDEGWTGAEIKQCAKIASRLNIPLTEAAAYIVPVSKSAADVIESLRRQASGKFISASKPGVYTMAVQSTQGKRAIQ